MTRKWFLGLLGIGAAGQEIQESHPIYTIPFHTVKHQPYKPANGECPVCGTMAPTYFPQKGRVVATYPPSNWPDEPPTRTVSCTHCRVRFDQDAEGAR